MPGKKRGRHQSSSKEGKKTIAWIEALPGVEGVILGHSFGGKAISRGSAAGDMKLQREEEAGFKAALQSSKGLQEIFIRVVRGKKEQVREAILKRIAK